MTTEIKAIEVNNFPDLELDHKTKDGDYDLSNTAYVRWNLSIDDFGKTADIEIKDVSIIGFIEVLKDNQIIGRLDLSKYPIEVVNELKSFEDIAPKELKVNEDSITVIFN